MSTPWSNHLKTSSTLIRGLCSYINISNHTANAKWKTDELWKNGCHKNLSPSERGMPLCKNIKWNIFFTSHTPTWKEHLITFREWLWLKNPSLTMRSIPPCKVMSLDHAPLRRVCFGINYHLKKFLRWLGGVCPSVGYQAEWLHMQ